MSYSFVSAAFHLFHPIALAKAHGFCTVVLHKKNRKFPWLYDKQLYKQRNNIKRYFLRLKRFRKVFTRYNRLNSIFISIISRFYFQFVGMLSKNKIFTNKSMLSKKILDKHFFYDILNMRVGFAVVMELVDVVDSKSTGGDTVPVRVRPTALFLCSLFFLS